MTKLKIATWNVNSIKARLPNVLAWVKEGRPDILLLQELKCLDEAFPAMEFEDLGYNLVLNGQKTYNGVAILSKFPIEDIKKKLPGDHEDDAARYIEAVISVPDGGMDIERHESPTHRHKGHTPLRVASIYVPNRPSPESEKFQYKQRITFPLQQG